MAGPRFAPLTKDTREVRLNAGVQILKAAGPSCSYVRVPYSITPHKNGGFHFAANPWGNGGVTAMTHQTLKLDGANPGSTR
jgi:hypothetical protein